MDIKRISSRGTMMTFSELKNSQFNCYTNIYIIETKNYIFICDTFIGPEIMKEVKKYIKDNIGNNPIIVFNSHYHWDHIWGNSIFEESLIISHKRCREVILEKGQEELDLYGEYKKGEIKLCFPNVTFVDKLIFEEEGLEFFFTPGHTEDSASCYDKVDNILFVGDNVEKPIPYISYNNLNEYLSTLKKYIAIKPEVIISGHSQIADINLVKEHIIYIDDIIKGNYQRYFLGIYKDVHKINMQFLDENSFNF